MVVFEGQHMVVFEGPHIVVSEGPHMVVFEGSHMVVFECSYMAGLLRARAQWAVMWLFFLCVWAREAPSMYVVCVSACS